MANFNPALKKELRTQLSIAIPVLFAQIAQISMGVVDTVMTGRVGALDMASVALAASLWLPIVLFGQGVILALTPSVAQLRGAGRSAEVPPTVRNGLMLALMLSVPLSLLLYVISSQLEVLGVEPALATISGKYLRVMIWGLPGYLLFIAMRCAMEGFSLVRPSMVAGIVALAVNVPCNWVLIFGNLGFPAMGAVGAAVASVFACWSLFFVLVIYAWRIPHLRACFLFADWRGPDWKILRALFGVGLPGAISMLCEVTQFAIVALLIAPLGAIMVAGHQVALNFSSVVFMFPLAVNMGATIRVGFCLGQGDAVAVRRATRVALGLGFSTSVVTALLTIFLREQITACYNNDPAVAQLATHLLLFAALYQCTDALQVVTVGVLRGYNDTRAILMVTFISYWLVALPLGYSLGRSTLFGPPLGPTGFWIAFVVGITLNALLLLTRLRRLERRLEQGGGKSGMFFAK